MLAVQITNLKDFMNKLFVKETFDRFLLSEATLTTFTAYHVDGAYHPEFFGEDQEDTVTRLCPWSRLRPVFFSLIRGKHTPLNFKIIFQLSGQDTERLLITDNLPFQPEDVFGLYMNVQYDGEKVTVTTGSSLKVFTLDKSLDASWDALAKRFFLRQGIEFV